MATVLESLLARNAYPIPPQTVQSFGVVRGLTNLSSEVTQEIMRSKAYRLVGADIDLWLSEAPNISQGGQSFSFTDEQRKRLRSGAMAVLEELDDNGAKTTYGYKGTRL